MTPRDLERFETRYIVEPNSYCWLWLGGLTQDGYPKLPAPTPARYVLAHRLAYEHFVGPLGGQQALHRCDVRACVNPEHLFAGSQIDNMADMVAKGRSPRGHRNYNSRLTEAQVAEIKTALRGGALQKDLVSIYNVSRTAISNIKIGNTWAHVGVAA